MKKVCKIFMVAYVLSSILTIMPSRANDNINGIVVKLGNDVNAEKFLADNNLTWNDVELGREGYLMIYGSEANVMTSTLKGAESIVDDDMAFIQSETIVPDDFYFETEQWNMKKIGMEEAWSDDKGDDDVVVAVLDTGLNFSHEDMRDLIWTNTDEIPGNGVDDDKNGFIDDYNGYNFVGLNNKISDDNDHGTGVSSIIVANSNNEVGIAGINWKAKIMPVKVASSSGSASLFDIAQGIYYAVDNGAKIINMSLGSLVDRDYVEEAVLYAYDHGVLMVAAAGNSHVFSPVVKTLYYPARYEQVLAVGGIGRDDKIAGLANASYLSHYGPDLDLVAPGVEIITADADRSNNSYTYFDGTSMASPHVAGAAALLLAKNSKLTRQDIWDTLIKSAEKLDAMTGDFDEKYGYGCLNVANALVMTKSDGNNDDDDNDNNNNDDDQDDQNYGSVYAATWVGQSNYWYLKPGETRDMWVEFKNTGDALWEKDDFNAVHLATDRTKDRVSVFYEPTNWLSNNRIEMVQDRVKPGEVARFEWVVKAPNYTGNFKEYYGLVSENNTWLNDMGVYWELNVTNDNIYSAWWNSQSEYLTMNKGETGKSWVEYVNNGTVAWQQEGNMAVHLGTDRPSDRSSEMYDAASWLTNNRIEMDSALVEPGEVARFSFDVDGTRKGFFREYFRPVVENVKWMNDWGVYIDYWVL